MIFRQRVKCASGAAALLVAATWIGSGAAQAAPSENAVQTIDGVVVTGLPPLRSLAALETYVAHNSTAVTMDVATGQPTTVTAGPGAEVRASYRQPCSSTDAFWEPSSTPYASLCFYGAAGSKTVSARSNVIRWHTGKYTARGGWIYGGKQNYTLKQGPHSTARLSGGTSPANFGQI